MLQARTASSTLSPKQLPRDTVKLLAESTSFSTTSPSSTKYMESAFSPALYTTAPVSYGCPKGGGRRCQHAPSRDHLKRESGQGQARATETMWRAMAIFSVVVSGASREQLFNSETRTPSEICACKQAMTPLGGCWLREAVFKRPHTP